MPEGETKGEAGKKVIVRITPQGLGKIVVQNEAGLWEDTHKSLGLVEALNRAGRFIARPGHEDYKLEIIDHSRVN